LRLTNEFKRTINKLQDDKHLFIRVDGTDYIIDTIEKDMDSLELSSDWCYVAIPHRADGMGIKK